MKRPQVPERAGLGKEGGTRPDRAQRQGDPATGHLHLSARRQGLSQPCPGHRCPSACHRHHLLSRPQWPRGERLSSEKDGGVLQTPMGGRKGGKTRHAEHPDGAAWLSSANSSGKRCLAVLSAVPAGELAAGVAVSAGKRMKAECPQGEGGGLGSWAPCVGPIENQGSLLARRAGAAAGTLESRPRVVPAQGQQEPRRQGQ